MFIIINRRFISFFAGQGVGRGGAVLTIIGRGQFIIITLPKQHYKSKGCFPILPVRHI